MIIANRPTNIHGTYIGLVGRLVPLWVWYGTYHTTP